MYWIIAAAVALLYCLDRLAEAVTDYRRGAK